MLTINTVVRTFDEFGLGGALINPVDHQVVAENRTHVLLENGMKFKRRDVYMNMATGIYFVQESVKLKSNKM